ncbi:nucleoside triphosphate pyrophosphohydrolase [Streptomyces sp. NBC_00006]|uniref:nucleoside triphosphate pyrophosphohydrolase n=1 Tax=Streptomyces sp. NBC_00006 TaxID=2975619 RepID=UPI00224E7C43|nr:nucleoside triphosphate pyrophosphohydrolase [Streptomyces sp. NBC_00006]MCX5528985.1 nucleoside triphosphate pyrophosphohydrolase [Streptomyces sp. NBC_00006]MCX5537783.1 nucleoside triphosphate pyrophosphohydrolase [Streptomyces sp. NBC_00006]
MTEKLIRDLIPKLAADRGQHLPVREAAPAELPVLLRMKLAEECVEAIDASLDGLLEELADVLEVVHALAGLHGHSLAELEQARAAKATTRGGFKQGFVLELEEGR